MNGMDSRSETEKGVGILFELCRRKLNEGNKSKGLLILRCEPPLSIDMNFIA
jgi:hypothetical protein